MNQSDTPDVLLRAAAKCGSNQTNEPETAQCIKNSCWYIIHYIPLNKNTENTNHDINYNEYRCEVHRFTGYTSEHDCFCKHSDSDNDEETSHQTTTNTNTNTNEEHKEPIAVFYDNQGEAVGAVPVKLTCDYSDSSRTHTYSYISSETNNELRNKLDPDAKFISVGAVIDRHIKVGQALWIKVLINDDLFRAFCGKFPVDAASTDECLLNHIKADERCKKFDLSNLTVDKIENNCSQYYEQNTSQTYSLFSPLYSCKRAFSRLWNMLST
jgi:hypothetical protein